MFNSNVNELGLGVLDPDVTLADHVNTSCACVFICCIRLIGVEANRKRMLATTLADRLQTPKTDNLPQS